MAHVSRLGQGVHDSLATSDLHLEILTNLRQFNSVVTRLVRPLAQGGKRAEER